jgi:hypothetical protein
VAKKKTRRVGVHLRLTEDERRRFESAALKANRTLSGWIRHVADKAAR